MTDKDFINCPVCSSAFDSQQTRRMDYPLGAQAGAGTLPRPHLIYFCPHCETGIAFPCMDEQVIDDLYTDGDYWRTYKVQILRPHKNPGPYAMARARWQFVAGHLGVDFLHRDLSILDIGGGHGFFGMAARQSRHVRLKAYCVVEKDKFFRDSLKLTWARYYPQTTCRVVDALEQVQGTFDVVVLSHLLEHLNDPKLMIQRAVQKLSPRGFLFVDVPNGDHSFKKDVFPHVLFYNTANLAALLRAAGLEVKAAECFGRNRQWASQRAHGQHRTMVFLEKVFYKFRHVIPVLVSQPFFSWYFQARRKNPDGTWIRALAHKA